MSWRYQLPVYSPLSLGALLGGLGAALGGGDRARRTVEAWIRERYGARQVLLTDSGTSALALAMGAASRRAPGKPILLPSYSCYDLVTAAMAAAVEVAWYDIDPGTLQPDWTSLQEGLNAGAAAVVLVHHYGIPADLARVRGLIAARAHGDAPLLIEDAAQAIGGSLDGRPLGGFGDFGVLSFGRGKGLTGGGGGALLANGREAGDLVAGLAADVRPSGRGGLVSTGAQWLLARPFLYAVPASLPFLQLGATVFRAPHSPRGMAAANAGVLARTIPLQESEVQCRNRNASRLLRSAGSWCIPVTGPGAGAGYLRLPLLLPEAVAVLRESPEARRLGIMPGYPVPLPMLPGSPFRGGPAPGAQSLAARLVTLPVHSLLRETDLARIERVLEAWAIRASRD